MTLRIVIEYKTTSTVRVFDTEQVRIGRFVPADPSGLDLSFDSCVSRLHAVIKINQDSASITDLDSRFGTLVNGHDIRKEGECRLWPEDTVVIGETTLRLALTPTGTELSEGPLSPAPIEPLPQITKMVDTRRSASNDLLEAGTLTDKRLAVLLSMPSQLLALSNVDTLCQFVMERVVEAIPQARRGALLLQENGGKSLLLKAYVSSEEPAVSETLAQRTMLERRAFIWRTDNAAEVARSVRELRIVQGMYSPIQWQENVFGVLCVDSPEITDTFQEADLRFLIAVGQYVGMALAVQQLRFEAGRSARLLDRLMANFSRKVRAVLVDKARHGKLRPGGIKSEVTVLFCDICGFTRMAASMDAQDVVELLNDYFEPLIEIIFQHEGSVDKFTGDGLLAVFGSPEADPLQHENAVRAALELIEAVRTTSQRRLARGEAICQLSIGVHCGEVFHGFVGTVDRLEFTVIGDAVNRASRYCSAAGENEVLISAEIFQRVYRKVNAEKLRVPSKEGELVAYRLKALRA